MEEGEQQPYVMKTSSNTGTNNAAGSTGRRSLQSTGLAYTELNPDSNIRNSTESAAFYFEFYNPHMIENAFTKILVWTFYLILVAPIILIIHCIVRKRITRWFHMKVLYSGTFMLFILTFVPFIAALIFEWHTYKIETSFDTWSLIFASVAGSVMVLVTLLIIFITCRHHRFSEVDKIRDKYNAIFMPFRPPRTCSMYWSAYMIKMIVLVTIILVVTNAKAVAWTYFSVALASFCILVVIRAFKLWSIYFFDLVLEFMDLIVIGMNVGLVYGHRGKSYQYWMMVFVLLKSLFVLFFVLVYCCVAWSKWLFALCKRRPENPNVAEQFDYYEKDRQDDDFDRIMNETHDPFFHKTDKEKKRDWKKQKEADQVVQNVIHTKDGKKVQPKMGKKLRHL